MRLTILLALALIALPVAAPAAPSVTLPDSGKYYWWLFSPAGGVQGRSKTSRDTSHLSFQDASPSSGDTLYVLNAHTGNIAVVPITTSSSAIALKTSDFHALPKPPPPPPPPARPRPRPAVRAKPAAMPRRAPAPRPQETQESHAGKAVSFLFGLIVLVGVVWFVKRLVDTRGQLLIRSARRMGVDVPDPDEIAGQSAPVEGRYVKPTSRAVEAVPEEALAPPEGEPSPQGNPAQLVGLTGPIAGRSFAIAPSGTSIGRDADNQIAINDTGISRRHALIREEAAGFVVHDEGSANGVFVNGSRVTEQVLRAGDTVQVGRIRFRFEG